ncbi:hypothetical protein AMAG_13877 [Allomyces macrogynus ATCC 38327]|uniref:Uncharacterized protein n=1 Tax=Allomyces macrogynus (strain ATCC 38327) TaxID=578462 RepID=A0A0L0T2T5_ALLM3|nr:hypothetical protein AMAG_13877 [Allomyces macrogynus ATCC 38327]|eukprot:KNE69002.1 hypothetical protein AMAG_13877 [Allomyces macrogynus ATCC 38327]
MAKQKETCKRWHHAKNGRIAAPAHKMQTVMARLEETMSEPTAVTIPAHILDSRNVISMIWRNIRSGSSLPPKVMKDETLKRWCRAVVYEAVNTAEVPPDKVFQMLAARAVYNFNVLQDW